MTPPADPYRTLGLARGASLAEAKRAYRALAKINHPDAAGPGALPRFLAIQAAYEQILRAAPTKGTTSRSAPKPAARPSEADPDRADAAHRAYGGRTRRARPGTGTGAGPTGAAGGGTRSGRERRADPGPASADPADDRDTTNKATLGSTSYDGTDGLPFEPDWGGASWYGTTSGTYWTINPKEYADPRKHGPEYQARARRAARDRSRAGSLDASAAGEPTSAAGEPTSAAGEAANEAERSAGEPIVDNDARSSSWGAGADATGPTTAAPSARPRPSSRARPVHAADVPPPDLAAAATDLSRALTDERTGRGRWRLVQALVGWLPIVFGLGWLIGEVTGCGRFAASCDGGSAMIAPAVGLLALAILVSVPALAALAASAALALVVLAVPTALALSAGGAATDPESRMRALGLVLVVAWIAGLGFALVRRIRAVS